MTDTKKEPGPAQTALAEFTATLDSWKKRIDQLPEEIPLGEDALVEQVTAGIKKLRELEAEQEAKRKDLQKPWQDRVNKIRDGFKPLVARCRAHKAYLTGLLNDWSDRDEKHKAEVADKLRAEAEAKAASDSVEDIEESAAKTAEAEAITRTAGKTKSADGASSFRRREWKAELVNKAKLIQAAAKGEVPMDWLDVNMSAVNKSVKELELREAPGLKIEEHATTQVR